MKIISRITSFIVLIIIITSCSTKETSVSYTIESDKKTKILYDSNLQLEFPKESVLENTKILVDSIKDISIIDHENYKAIGMAYLINVDAKKLEKKAKVLIDPIPFYMPNDVMMGRFDGKKWHYLKLELDDISGKWVAMTDRFSTYAPMIQDEEPFKEIEKFNDPISFAKNIIDGEKSIFWDKVTYKAAVLVYYVGGGIAMNGGSYVLLKVPSLTLSLYKGGLIDAGIDVSKDILIETYKSAIKSPDKVSKKLAKETIIRSLKEYKIAYKIAQKYRTTGQMSQGEAIMFIENQYGAYRLNIARMLYNRSLHFDFDKVINSDALNEATSLIEKKYLNANLPLADALSLGMEINDIMKLNKIGLQGFKPYLEFTNRMEQIETEKMRVLNLIKKNNHINFDDEFLGSYINQENEGEVSIRTINIVKNNNSYFVKFDVFYDSTSSFIEPLIYSGDSEYPYLFSYTHPDGEVYTNKLKFIQQDGVDYMLFPQPDGETYMWNIWKKNQPIIEKHHNNYAKPDNNKDISCSENKIKALISNKYNIKLSDIVLEKAKNNFTSKASYQYLILFADNSIELGNRELKSIIISNINGNWIISHEIALPSAFALAKIEKIIDINNDGIKEFLIKDANGYQGSSWDHYVMYKYINGKFSEIYNVKDEQSQSEYSTSTKRKLEFKDYNNDGIIDIIETIEKGKPLPGEYEPKYKLYDKRVLTFDGSKYILLKSILSDRESNNSSDNQNSKLNNDENTGTLLNENFNDNLLDSRIYISKTGEYISSPDIKTRSEFGGSYCFGFGKSNCSGNCFNDYKTDMIIRFKSKTYVSNISFKVMELDGDWGNGGFVYIDGEKVANTSLGSSPSNDSEPDKNYRLINIDVNHNISSINISVSDITNSSEIFIDDLVISN